MCTCYRSIDNDDIIKCHCIGSSKDIHQSFILAALKECSKNNKMKSTDIKMELENKGIKSIVIKNFSQTYRNQLACRRIDGAIYSEWTSTKHGKYCIIILEFRPKNSTEIKCLYRGTMKENDINCVLNVLKYCLRNKTMTVSTISNELWKKNKSNLVLKGCKSFAKSLSPNQCIKWCSFEVTAFGVFAILFTNIISVIE